MGSTLNTPQETLSDSDKKELRSSRLKLAILIIVPFALMAIAWTMFYTGVGMPVGTANKGELIDPPLQLSDAAPELSSLFENNGQWFFVQQIGRSCDEHCSERLYLSRQIRIAMGKNTHKLQRLFLLDPDTTLAPAFQELLETEHADASIQAVSKQAFDELQASNQSNTDVDLYIADNRGFMMLYYTPEHGYKETMKDLKFLLKYAPE